MAQTRWLVLASFYLDSGTERFASARVKHPDYIYEAYALNWGSIEKSIPVPSGLPQISEAQIRLADTTRHWRDLLAHQSPRRRMIDIRLVQEGESVSGGNLVFSGEVVDAVFGPGYIDLTLRDRTFAWLDEPIPAMLIKDIYPDIPDKNEGGFLNIISGYMRSPDTSPSTATGVIPCPHFGLVAEDSSPPLSPPVMVDRYGVAMHPCADIPAVYRKVSHLNAEFAENPGSEWEIVDPSEYTITEVEVTAFGVDMTHTFIDFLVDQADAEIRADVDGIDRRGQWGSLAAIDPSSPPAPILNPIDFFINVTFLLLHKAGVSVNVFDTDDIADLWQVFENYLFPNEGVVDRVMTGREFLGRFLACWNLDMFCKSNGKITLNFTDATDPNRPVFSEGRLILRDSFFERLPDPIVNQIVYRFQHNPTGKGENDFFTWGVYNDEEAQESLGFWSEDSPPVRVSRVEKEVFDEFFNRDPTVALDIATRRAEFEDFGSFRQEFQLPAPPVLDDVELGRLIGLTHSQGLETGGYENREAKIYSIRLDLDQLKFTVKTVLRVPQSMAVAGLTARPRNYEEWEDDPPVNPARSFITNGDKAIDEDAGYGLSGTYSELTFISSTAVAMHAQLFLYNIQSTAPPGFTSVTIHVVASNVAGVSTLGPGPAISGIVQQYRETAIPGQPAYAPALAGTIFSLDYSVTTGPTEYTKTFTAAEFASFFGSSSTNIWLRFNQWNTATITTSSPYLLRIWDAWLTWG